MCHVHDPIMLKIDQQAYRLVIGDVNSEPNVPCGDIDKNIQLTTDLNSHLQFYA